MRKLLMYFALFLPVVSNAQDYRGIDFKKDLSLKEVFLKAKSEHKNVFLDVYATWCAPCKVMDRDVYPLQEVGTAINANFIALKVQVDTSKNDNEEIRAFYGDARLIKDRYAINSLPTFLFFNSEGKLVHQDIGLKSTPEFLTMIKGVVTLQDNYFSKVERFRNGEYGTCDSLISLYFKTLNFKNNVLADSIGSIIYKTFLLKLPDTQLLTSKNLTFIGNAIKLVSSEDQIFKLSLSDPDRVSKVRGIVGWATNWLVTNVITKEEIAPNYPIYSNSDLTEKRWQQIERNIKIKYPEVDAKMLVAKERMYYYRDNNLNWLEYVIAKNKYLALSPPVANKGSEVFFDLNGAAWDVFLNTNDPYVLREALKWSDKSIKLEENIQYLDTRANLLYKLGRIDEGIRQEEIALKHEKDSALKNGQSFDETKSEYFKLLNKMRRGEPTWPIKKQ